MQDFEDSSQNTFVNPPQSQPVPPQQVPPQSLSPQSMPQQSPSSQPLMPESSQWGVQQQPMPPGSMLSQQEPPPQLPLQQPVPPPQPRKAGVNWIWYVIGGVVLCGILVCLAYFAGAGSNQQKNEAGQTPSSVEQSSVAQTTAPASTTPDDSSAATAPAEGSMPESTSATQPVETPSQQTPSQPTYTAPMNSIDPSVVITRQAYEMVLTLDDMGSGWSQSSAASPKRGFIYSSSHVIFSQGSSFAPVVQNTVTVYRSIDAAADAYEKEVPTTATGSTLSHPNIGNECFLNDAVTNNKVLVFRKNNVVVWIQIQQDKTGDPLYYAQIVNQKITP